ncbi:MAG: hypothetical protein FWH29_02340 [Methanobrevibacter sp.]|nr:hypothetical protein [Methanobrevibacter sp.]
MDEILKKFLDERNKRYIIPIEIEKKEEYIYDIQSLDNSVSDILNFVFSPIFNMNYESIQMIINSIYLFEIGYFDAAFYSLRQSIEISTTMVFLSELSEDEREHEVKKWSSSGNFPMRGKMVKNLENNGKSYSDMLDKMPNFFENIQKINKRINKFVHKQGFKHFYSINFSSDKEIEKYKKFRLKEFEFFLKECICIIAVMRLALDPFPILLMDDEIEFRVFDILTEPYDYRIMKYIDDNIIEEYKTTHIYQKCYNHIMNEEKRNNAVNNVVRNHYIDLKKIDKIWEQKHLLKEFELITINIFQKFSKINTIVIYGIWYGMDEKLFNVTGLSLQDISNSKNKFNQKFNDFFISAFHYENDHFYLLNEETFSDKEINEIKRLIYAP